MLIVGRILCFLAILGLGGQLLGAVVTASQPIVVAVLTEDLDQAHDRDLYFPEEPFHCPSCCALLGMPAFADAQSFLANNRAIALLPLSEESPQEGYPAGLFIPPKVS